MKKCVSLKRHSQASVDGCGKLVMWQWFHWPIWLQHAMCYSCHPMSDCRLCRWRVWGWCQVNDSFSNIWKSRSFSLTFWKPLIFFSAETAVRKAFRECENRGSRDLANMQAAKSCPFLPFLVKWQKTKTSGPGLVDFFLFFFGHFSNVYGKRGKHDGSTSSTFPENPQGRRGALQLLKGAQLDLTSWVAESFHFWWSSKYVQISFWFRGIFFGPEDPGPPPPFKPEVRLARKWEQTLNQRERFGPPRTVGWCIVMVSVYRM